MMNTATATATEPIDAEVGQRRASTSLGLVWPLLLIAALTAYTGVMIRHSYFYADDFLSFGYAHRLGLSWSLLDLNLFGHIAPTERFLHWLPLTISPLNYAVGECVILTLYALLLLSFLWVLRELRANPVVVLALLLVTGSSVVLLNATLYYGQTVFLLPASTFILCISALFIRWIRTGRLWAIIGSWVVFAASFITQERPLVVLVYLVLLRYIVLPYRPAPGGSRRWLSDWRIWLPFAVVASAYVAWYLSVAPHSKTNLSEVWEFLGLIGQAFVRLAVGLPVTGSSWVTWVAVAVVLILFAFVMVVSSNRPLVARATVFFLICFLVNLGVVFQGVSGAIGLKGIADQIQYYLDSLFVLGMAVGIVCSDWLNSGRRLTSGQQSRSSGRARRAKGSGETRWVVPACIVVVAYLIVLPFGVSSVDRLNSHQPVGRQWMSNFMRSLSAIDAAHSGTVIPLTMPAAFDPGFESPFDLEANVFPLLPAWHAIDTGPVGVAGPTGEVLPVSAGDSVTQTASDLRAATLTNLKLVTGPPGAACFKGSSRQGQILIGLPHSVGGSVVAGDFLLTASRPFSAMPVSEDGSRVSFNVPVSVTKESRRVIVPFALTPLTSVGLTAVSPGAHFCLTSVQVGAVLEHTYDGRCQIINIYGQPSTAKGCGVPWVSRSPASARADTTG
jgi:hypothetical protein